MYAHKKWTPFGISCLIWKTLSCTRKSWLQLGYSLFSLHNYFFPFKLQWLWNGFTGRECNSGWREGKEELSSNNTSDWEKNSTFCVAGKLPIRDQSWKCSLIRLINFFRTIFFVVYVISYNHLMFLLHLFKTFFKNYSIMCGTKTTLVSSSWILLVAASFCIYQVQSGKIGTPQRNQES